MEDLALIGRLPTQAPEIDGVVYLSETEAKPGEFVDITITDAREYDLMGTAWKEKKPIVHRSAQRTRRKAY
jgi:ribosomal protein S12 methylthiotransferase